MDATLVYIIGSTITRLGTMALLVLGIQILVSLYRADVLELLKSEQSASLSDLITAMSPDQIKFGKSPVSPTEQVVELASKFASAKQ
jgi:hypothetical protein